MAQQQQQQPSTTSAPASSSQQQQQATGLEIIDAPLLRVPFESLKRVAKELGENMTEEELQDMIDQADRDGDGEINPDEFYRIMKKRGDNPLDDLLDDV